ILEAVERLLADNFKPRRTLYLAFGHDEESGGFTGAARIARLLKARNVQPEFILDEGGMITKGILIGVTSSVALIGVAEKGYMSVELTVESAGGHASTPPRQTAIGILSAAIHRIEADQ
ncbi:MAG: M20/M25/M40 family metallo-hydrolase, partial [Armatimonadetes bacterium]|nr:M20/M25/M40 family metallo-hydrolase [Armatimonadota bacterium]NIM23691.1 M20/M25/M40 family metallo-hydrolase [Armatimonadota bacterium]NIM68394.1 M20/M25/M40 family metallo-hydrolase [Armatimonadota bacterium]NIN05774.1 M20/M25/M40 family metallo-hydrolase [Armatimonadota bacterium]NIO95538.1 M20/M25/M40 family metallo-hydrolase [Armatimonadota bacterium]